jgi:hypothetical protein
VDRNRTTALIIGLIRAADISALDGISTRRGSSQISLSHCRVTENSSCIRQLRQDASGWYGRCAISCQDAK